MRFAKSVGGSRIGRWPYALSGGIHAGLFVLSLAMASAPLPPAAARPEALFVTLGDGSAGGGGGTSAARHDEAPSLARLATPSKTRLSEPSFQESRAVEEMQPPLAEAQSSLGEALLGDAEGSGSGGGVRGGTGAGICHVPPCGSGDGGGVSDSYLALIQKHLRENLRYPYAARRMGAEGTVILRFEVGTDGRAREVTVVRQCPFRVLTQAAIESLRSAEPLPVPTGYSTAALFIEVPITFVLE